MTLYIGFGKSVAREVQVDWDIVRRGTVVVGRYLDPLIMDLVGVAGEHGVYPMVFDYMGLLFDVDFGFGDMARYLVGVDLPFNVLNPPKHIDKNLYFDILASSLSIVCRFLDVPRGVWKPLFIDFLNGLFEREGCLTNELVMSELEVLRNEASGLDKKGYSYLYNVLRLIIYSSEVRRIYFVDEPIDYDLVVGAPSIINYGNVSGFYSRLFLYIVSMASSLLVNRHRFNVMFCGELYIPLLDCVLLNTFYLSMSEMPYLIHFNRFDEVLANLPVYNVFLDNSYMASVWVRRGFDPLKYSDYSTHHLVSMGRLLPIRIEGEVFRITREPEAVEVPEEYSPDERLVREILSRVRDLGGVGVEGIYMYMRERRRGEVYMAVDWLWRNGFLRRERLGGGYVYKITVKGLMRLKEESGGDG